MSDDDLKQKYNGFLIPIFEIKVNNKNIYESGIDVHEIRLEMSIDPKADIFEFRINPKDIYTEELHTEWIEKYFQLGSEVEIKLGYEKESTSVFKGMITNVEFSLSGEEAWIIVNGMDDSFRFMMDVKEAVMWEAQSITEMVDNILSKYGVIGKKVDSTNDETKKTDANSKWRILQSNESDFQFVKRLAEEFDFEFYIQKKTAYFKKRTIVEPELTLNYSTEINDFSIKQNVAGVFSKVTVLGMSDKKERIKASVDSSQVKSYGSGSKTGGDVVKKIAVSELKVYDPRAISTDDATKIGRRLINVSAMGFVTGHCESVGIPEIMPGIYLKIDGIGEEMNNTYYVTSVTHSYNQSGYTTQFEFRGNKI